MVIQRNELNSLEGYSNVIIVPLTTKGRKSVTYVEVSRSEANRLTAPSWAITNQIFTIDQGDLREPLGRISREELYKIKEAILFVIDAQRV